MPKNGSKLYGSAAIGPEYNATKSAPSFAADPRGKMSVFTAGEGNDPLPAGVIAATQHRHLAQIVRYVTAAFAPGAAWISGHADEWHADVWRQAGTRLRRLIGTRGLHGVLIEQSELRGTQDQRAYRVAVERVFRNRAFELVFSRVNVVIECLHVRTGQECGLSRV